MIFDAPTVTLPPRLTIEVFLAADREYRRLVAKSRAMQERRSALPPGSARARVTSANAKWMRAAEARDRRERELRAAWEAAAQSVAA